MAQLAPSLGRIKSELRLDHAGDDELIAGYIAAAQQLIAAQILWMQADQETIPIFNKRFAGSDGVILPVRGAATAAISYKKNNGDIAAAMDFTLSTAITKRHLSFLTPTASWDESMPAAAPDATAAVVLIAGDAPELIISAMTKMAVDFYMFNGIGRADMKTAVDRMLEPIEFLG